MKRRDLLKGLLAAAATTVVRVPIRAAAGVPVTRFGVITDVHQDVMPDAVERMRAFVAAMNDAKPDFVIQLGDFCMPKDTNREFLTAFQAFKGPKHHVIGNHDIEPPFTREQVAGFWGMSAPHYTFDAPSFLGVVLDGNDAGGTSTLYRRFIGPDQLAWIEKTLMTTTKPVVLFVHQPIDGNERYDSGVENVAQVKALIDKVEAAKPGTVLASFSGHRHQDYVKYHAGSRTPYCGVNSASYYWLGQDGQSLDYFPADVHAKYPQLRNVAVYREPLWELVEIDRAAGEVRVIGRESHWIGASAIERLHLQADAQAPDFIHPSIRSKTVDIQRAR